MRHLQFAKEIAGPEANPRSWVRYLKRVVRDVQCPLVDGSYQFPEPEPVHDDSEWRVVQRPSLVAHVEQQLDHAGAVAVTGMSGAGKTLLARQVANTLTVKGKIVEQYDARHWLRTPRAQLYPETKDYLSLLAEIVRVVAYHSEGSRPNRSQQDALRTAFTDFKRYWSTEFYAHEQPNAEDEKERAIFFQDIRDHLDWPTFIDALKTHAPRLHDIELLSDAANILGIAGRSVVLVLDNVIQFGVTAPVIGPLLAQHDRSGYAGPRLLIASIQTDSLSFVGDDLDVNLDRLSDDVREAPIEFARAVVAAGATPGPPSLSPQESKQRIAVFRKKNIEERPDIRNGIDAMIARLQGHPLALTVIATAWRNQLEDDNFWFNASETLDKSAQYLLVLNRNRKHDEVPDKRHYETRASERLPWAAEASRAAIV